MLKHFNVYFLNVFFLIWTINRGSQWRQRDSLLRGEAAGRSLPVALSSVSPQVIPSASFGWGNFKLDLIQWNYFSYFLAPATRYFEGCWSLVKSQRDSKIAKFGGEDEFEAKLLTLFSEEKLFGTGVDNGVGGVVSGHHEVVGTAAPVSVTNWQTLMTTYLIFRLGSHKEFLQSPRSALPVRHCWQILRFPSHSRSFQF